MNVKDLFSQKTVLCLAVTALLGSLSACEKDDEIVASAQVQTEEIANAEAVADDIFEDADEISLEAVAIADNARMMENDSTLRSACVDRKVERSGNNGFTKIVTLTFEQGCVGPKGRERSGTIIVNRKIDFEASTYTVTTTFQDFYVNGKKIEGTRTLVFTAEDNNLRSITLTLADGKVTLEDGKIIIRSGEFTKTIDRETGEITLEGGAQGITRAGVAYTATITEPIVYKKSCVAEGVYMAVQGKKSITREGKPDFDIDYGDGTCDKEVTITAEGESRMVEINITKK